MPGLEKISEKSGMNNRIFFAYLLQIFSVKPQV